MNLGGGVDHSAGSPGVTAFHLTTAWRIVIWPIKLLLWATGLYLIWRGITGCGDRTEKGGVVWP